MSLVRYADIRCRKATGFAVVMIQSATAEKSPELYRKSWLLNDLVPGFDAGALSVRQSAKARPLSCGFICASRFSLVWPPPQKTQWARTAPAAGLPPLLLEALRQLAAACSRLERRFLNLSPGAKFPLEFSNKVPIVGAESQILTIRCVLTGRSPPELPMPGHVRIDRKSGEQDHSLDNKLNEG